MRAGRKVSDFANTRSVVVGHYSMYTFNLNVGIGLDYSSMVGTGFSMLLLFKWSSARICTQRRRLGLGKICISK